MIYYIPIEPLDERYTEQWYRWFPKEFKKQNLEYKIIDGETLTNKIKTGAFLDINSTLFYKSEQLKKIAQLFYNKEIKNGDVFFVADIEFWGIEAIKYLAILQNINIKLYGFCHAASYTKEDYFSITENFAQHHERAWFNTFDLIFVGSEYHKRQIINLRGVAEEKIIVTGNPYNISEVYDSIEIKEKKNWIILTNRPDYEKRPNLSLDIFEILKNKFPEWEFIVVTSRSEWGNGWIKEKAKLLENKGIIKIYSNLSKKEYLSLLQQSKFMLSNSIEENFGYCILESLIFNTVPILPNDYSHPELVENDSRLLFNSINECINKLSDYIQNNGLNNYPINIKKYAMKYNKSLDKIVNIIKDEQ